jgi:hypothetical protein
VCLLVLYVFFCTDSYVSTKSGIMVEDFPWGLQALESNGTNTRGPNAVNFLDGAFTGLTDSVGSAGQQSMSLQKYLLLCD